METGRSNLGRVERPRRRRGRARGCLLAAAARHVGRPGAGAGRISSFRVSGGSGSAAGVGARGFPASCSEPGLRWCGFGDELPERQRGSFQASEVPEHV